ncbi:hypothetical protein, partial [Campylobacter volucris]
IAKFKNEARFMQTKFLAKTDVNNTEVKNNFIETHFENKCYFSEVKFKGKVSFAVSRFKGETLFANILSINNILEFNQVEFNRVKFVNTAERLNSYYFSNSTFKSIANFENLNINDLIFYNVVFENIVTFDKINFNNKPNFENCTFSNQFNIEHKYIEYNFQDLQNRTNNITDKYKALLDARDLFRKLKSNRIAHHNLIDASELRAQELYTRELELKYKENKSLKEKIERWQLFFYRKLCDHHTDLLLNLKWLVYIIALYVLFLGKIPIVYPACIIVLIVCMYCKKTKNIQLILSFIIIFITICFSPKLIFGVSNLFSDSLNWWQNLITAVYMVILGLILFSLQKTARKNSIVPN